MALTKLAKNLNNVIALPDEPNENGYTSDAIKETFDKAANDIKDYINNTLTLEIDENLATKQELHNVVVGQVPELGEIDDKITVLSSSLTTVQNDVASHLSNYLRNPYSGPVDTSSTSAAYTVTLNPPLNAYADGLPITIIPNVDCAANPTLNINGKGATPLCDADGNQLKAGDMKANKPYSYVRVGSNFFIRSGGAGKVISPRYTGNYKATLLSATKGYIECYTSGVLSFTTHYPDTFDIFMVGGGGAGGQEANGGGGSGGGGGYTKTYKKATDGWKDGSEFTAKELTINIGAGGTNRTQGGATSIPTLSISANGGQPGPLAYYDAYAGAGGSGGGGILSAGGADGSNGVSGKSNDKSYGGTGQGHTTRWFGETAGTLYAGGGGGGEVYTGSTGPGAGGAGGGGAGGAYVSPGNAGANGYGGGGGGGGGSVNGVGGTGGSGIVIVRWGY